LANRILVVDDHDVVRQGVLLILRSHPEWEVVGEASDGFEAIAKTQSLHPDLIILDISMPRKDGLEVLAELAQMKQHARVLILTMHESKELAAALESGGASGYVVKTQAGRDLVPAVQNILNGDTFFPSGSPPAPNLDPQPTPKKKSTGIFRVSVSRA
jgi:DNA-binding NarL/FixJ family response regulator